MENELKYTKYALISRPLDLAAYVNSDVSRGRSKLSVVPGTLIKLIKSPPSSYKNEKFSVLVQVLDSDQQEDIYECHVNSLVKVYENLWPFVIGISFPERRLRLVNNKDKCRWLVELRVNDLVSVKGDLFNQEGFNFDCIIRYIGPVEELNPVGYFFGLELLHLNCGFSPQSETIPFAIKYMQCNPDLSIFTTADWIIPVSSGAKKPSARQLINDTFERVCSVIAPAPPTIQRGDKRPRNRQPTAQFYDQPILPMIDHPVATFDPTEMEKTITSNNELDNLERTEAELLKNKKHTKKNGILKHTKSPTVTGIKDAGGDKPLPPSSLMDIPDREIIVINKAAIKESTQNESSVIVVDNPPSQKDVDLADLLGTNWPVNAGGAATILNRNPIAPELKDNDNVKFGNDSKKPIQTEKEDLNYGTIADYKHLSEIPGSRLAIGSLVEVSDSELSDDLYGVIRWIGITPCSSKNVLVGIELEDDANLKNLSTSDGSYNGVRLFKCHEGRAVFVPPNKCTMDRRFIDMDGSNLGGKVTNDADSIIFGIVDCPSVFGSVPPLSKSTK